RLQPRGAIVAEMREGEAMNARGGHVDAISSSCPALCRASTPFLPSKTWMAGTSPAMTKSIQSVSDGNCSHPHRHQHIERGLVVLVLHQGRRTGIGEPEHGDLALDLAGDVEQIARVESDIERVGGVLDLDLFG